MIFSWIFCFKLFVLDQIELNQKIVAKKRNQATANGYSEKVLSAVGNYKAYDKGKKASRKVSCCMDYAWESHKRQGHIGHIVKKRPEPPVFDRLFKKDKWQEPD